MILRADEQFLAAHEERSDQQPFSQHARESPAVELGDTHWCPDVGFVPRKRDRLHLPVGQSLLFAKRLRRAGVPVQNALIQRANPQVHFIPSEDLDVEIAQSRVQLPNLFPIVEKYAALLCADQQMPCSHRQDSGN